jgi:hypothetical protein
VVVIADICEDGKPKTMDLLYQGKGPEGTKNSQDGNEVILEGDADEQNPAFIVVRDHKNKIISEGFVPLNGVFSVSAAGNKRIPPRTNITIFDDDPDQDGTLLETIQFHTSCSQPLFAGDEFGSITVIGGE